MALIFNGNHLEHVWEKFSLFRKFEIQRKILVGVTYRKMHRNLHHKSESASVTLSCLTHLLTEQITAVKSRIVFSVKITPFRRSRETPKDNILFPVIHHCASEVRAAKRVIGREG